MTIKELYIQAYSILRFLESNRWLYDTERLTLTVMNIHIMPEDILCYAIDSFEHRFDNDPLCGGLFQIKALTGAPPGYMYDDALNDYIPEDHPLIVMSLPF
jgi:hypothetical protein